MPMYSFECSNDNCKHQSEKILKVDERDSPIECSKCGSTAIRVIAQTSPPVFRGDSGWTPKFYPKN